MRKQFLVSLLEALCCLKYPELDHTNENAWRFRRDLRSYVIMTSEKLARTSAATSILGRNIREREKLSDFSVGVLRLFHFPLSLSNYTWPNDAFYGSVKTLLEAGASILLPLLFSFENKEILMILPMIYNLQCLPKWFRNLMVLSSFQLYRFSETKFKITFCILRILKEKFYIPSPFVEFSQWLKIFQMRHICSISLLFTICESV